MKLCPVCATMTEHHPGKASCRAQRESDKARARGLAPFNSTTLNTIARHVAEALTRFGYRAEMFASRLHPVPGTAQVWSTEDGVALAHTIGEVARLLAISYPEAARRLHEHQELIGPFGTAWRLGGTRDDVSLREILQPIDYVVGSNGKRRQRKLVKLLGVTAWWA